MKVNFDNSYARLPERFYERVKPTPVQNPQLIKWNEELARDLGLGIDVPAAKEGVSFWSGNQIMEGSEPLAQAYSGHQFGYFSPQLGDGRAHLLGEVLCPHGKRFDLQLKGSGKTRFSRRGDGRAALGPMIREYILGEYMHAVGIPTTRALSLVSTGEIVMRETPLPGAVLTRVAASHIRVGTFEYFFSQQDQEAIKILADHVAARHYPELLKSGLSYQNLYAEIVKRQAVLVARWMLLGFVHGVMNTDNVAVSGETIDYGPCAFLDEYHPLKVFSSIDREGRYAYGRQGPIARWNLGMLGNCLMGILDPVEERAKLFVTETLDSFLLHFHRTYASGMAQKLGFELRDEKDVELIESLLTLMTQFQADFTLTFDVLTEVAEGKSKESEWLEIFHNHSDAAKWLQLWRQRRESEVVEISQMRSVNPCIVPRNHVVEEVIKAAEAGNFSPFESFVSALKTPFVLEDKDARYRVPPRPEQKVTATFCGT